MRAKATVDVCCHYELRAGNKILLDLGNDTTKLDAFFVNQYDLLPSCKGLLLAEDNAAISSQFTARARIFATEVLPVPRVPQKR